MKLFTTITSERGKPVTKSGNDYINIEITCGDDRKILAEIEVKRNLANVEFYTIYCNGEKIAERIKVNASRSL